MSAEPKPLGDTLASVLAALRRPGRKLRTGSLFAGYGGLDMGVNAVLGSETVWFSEFDPAPSKILAHHWPDVPNHGDITKIDWSTVEPVDILTGGFPCQDVSLAGRRAGITEGTRSGLWSEFARAIDVLRPGLVVIENVRGLLSAKADGAMEPDPWGLGDGATRPVINALGVVLGDLASMGYDTVRGGFRASDAGAPHGRFRVFILAYPTGSRRAEGKDCRANHEDEGSGTWSEESERGSREQLGTTTANANGRERDGREREEGRGSVRGTSVARDSDEPATDWGPYEPAIRRWERVLGRQSPPPTRAIGRDRSHRLSPAFVEFMMGLPVGHVSGPEILLTRAQQLKVLGNGVVPQQAELAVRYLLSLCPPIDLGRPDPLEQALSEIEADNEWAFGVVLEELHRLVSA